MGLICCKDINDPIKCVKSHDTFRIHYGGKSQRTSCRTHNWSNELNYSNEIVTYCKTCHRNKKEILSSNCYHICYKE